MKRYVIRPGSCVIDMKYTYTVGEETNWLFVYCVSINIWSSTHNLCWVFFFFLEHITFFKTLFLFYIECCYYECCHYSGREECQAMRTKNFAADREICENGDRHLVINYPLDKMNEQ